MSLDICRICGNHNNLKFIIGVELLEKLHLCANIEINYEDNLPKYICQKCDEGLEFSYRLRKQSEETEKKLRGDLETSSNVFVPPKQFQCEIVDRSTEENKSFIVIAKKQATLEPKQEEKSEYLDNADDMEFQSITEGSVYDEVGGNLWHKKYHNDCIIHADNILHEDSEEMSDKREVQKVKYKKEEEQSVTELKVNNESADDLIELSTEVFMQPKKYTPENGPIQPINNVYSYVCDTCHWVMDTQSEYRLHIKQHGKQRFYCIQCNKWFPTRFRFKQHELRHSEDIEMHKCPHCESVFRSRGNMNRHIRNAHEEKRNFSCNICTESFGRADILKNHMVTHTEERNYVCELCLESFKCQRYLDSHMKIHNPKTDSESSSKSKKENGISESTESKKKTYYCAHCGKVSKHHFTHKNHLRTHTQEKPYPCEECPKKFRTMAALITHERVHTDTRPYQCDVCLASFRQQSHLKEHRLTHAGISPYVCDICEMTFTKKGNMNAHMQVHTGEKPYKCIRCEQRFTKLSSLRRHAANLHKNSVKLVESVEFKDNEYNTDVNNENNACGSTNEYEDNSQQSIDCDIYNTDDCEQYDSDIIEIVDEDDVPEREADENNSDVTSDMNSDYIIDMTGSMPNDNIIGTNVNVHTNEGNLLPSSHLNEEDFCAGIGNTQDASGIMLVIDDEDKFNSLYIMDDIMES